MEDTLRRLPGLLQEAARSTVRNRDYEFELYYREPLESGEEVIFDMAENCIVGSFGKEMIERNHGNKELVW